MSLSEELCDIIVELLMQKINPVLEAIKNTKIVHEIAAYNQWKTSSESEKNTSKNKIYKDGINGVLTHVDEAHVSYVSSLENKLLLSIAKKRPTALYNSSLELSPRGILKGTFVVSAKHARWTVIPKIIAHEDGQGIDNVEFEFKKDVL